MPESLNNLSRRSDKPRTSTPARRERQRETMRALRARRRGWRWLSLQEIADAVGIRLSAQSSLDPRWWSRVMGGHHLY